MKPIIRSGSEVAADLVDVDRRRPPAGRHAASVPETWSVPPSSVPRLSVVTVVAALVDGVVPSVVGGAEGVVGAACGAIAWLWNETSVVVVVSAARVAASAAARRDIAARVRASCPVTWAPRPGQVSSRARDGPGQALVPRSSTASCRRQPVTGSWASHQSQRSSSAELAELGEGRAASRRARRRARPASTARRSGRPRRRGGGRVRRRSRRPTPTRRGVGRRELDGARRGATPSA